MADIEKIEFEFPDEAAAKAPPEESPKEAASAEPELEIIDDTPAEDKGRKPLEKPVDDPTEDELQEYGDKVKTRIKELTRARHDERRAKEAMAREREESLRLAQSMMEENKRLKERLTKGESTFVTQAQRLAEIEVEKAKAALKAAHETGDTEAFVEAQTALNRAQFVQERVKNIKPTPLQTEEQPANVQNTQAQQPPVQVDQKALAWRQKNSWFGEDDEMTSFALGLHNKLVRTGYDPQSDEYYEAVDARLRQVFPEQFKPAEKPVESSPKKPATVVAPSNRSTSATKIRLTQSQVNIAKRLGVPLELYAKQVAEQMRNQNG